MKTIVTVLLAAMTAAAAESDLPEGWSPKFYPGLEAVGSVETLPGGFKGKEVSICLKWESGAMKFGIEKEVKTKLSGWVDWTIEADVKSDGDYGYAGAAMSFLDGLGRPVGSVSNLKPIVAREWGRAMWMFSAPKEARRFFVQLLSLNREPVMFANIKVTARQGTDKGEIPFEVMALPAEKNVWWNGGKARTLNFSDAPIPTIFYVKGAKKGRDAIRLLVDVPTELEIRDAYCPNAAFYEALRPLAVEAFRTNGTDFVRYAFGNAKFMAGKSFGTLSPERYGIDAGTGIALVIAPKAGTSPSSATYPIRYRMALGEKRGQEKSFEMEFRPLPKNLMRSKDFFVFSWNNVDRHFASDEAATAAARAYEAAGLRSFRRTQTGGGDFDRKAELAVLYEKRPARYVFSGRFGDLWRLSPCGLGKADAKELGVRMAVSSDACYANHAKNKMCPQYFITDPRFHAYLRGHIRKVLQGSDVKDGDWVTFDMEPWHSDTWCHCEECHKAFAKFAGLDHVPDAAETQNEALRDKWALFRCSHNEKSVEIVSRFIREYNPTLKCMDYDYVMPYGDEAGMMARRRVCGKDAFENEKWLDGHICSYYHTIDKAAFDAIRNDTRHLKKTYVPMGANDGAGTYLQPHEVLSPKQVRQFALAAFVHGCPGIGFYSGNVYDGETLLALMEAQHEIARYEGLPWGKVDSKAEPTCANRQFAFATTVRPDGTEVVALFNYEADESVRVSLAGREYDVEPFGVRFVEIKEGNDDGRKELSLEKDGEHRRIDSMPLVCHAVETVKGQVASLLPDDRKFKLVWNDEFDGDSLDESKWCYRTNFWGRRAHWFAAPEDGAVEVKDGRIHLRIVKKPDGQFVSPQLQTGELMWDIAWDENRKGFFPLPKREKPKFVHRYGYYECRFRLQRKTGWWSAFWMQTEQQGCTLDPEISGVEHDIMESLKPGEIIGHCFHANGYSRDHLGFKTPRTKSAFDKNAVVWVGTDDFHMIGMLWEPDGYTVYIDGRQHGPKVGGGAGEAVSHIPEFVLLTTECKPYREKRMTAQPDEKLRKKLDAAVEAGDDFVVDFVRVYDVVN